MEHKPINREWVKSAAIVFLAVMLVLTFFSNTIMNRSLPEVATQMVSDGSITAKVRGTGTVTANGLHQVKADQSREIRAVMVKEGQEIAAGDVLFILGEGDSEELEAAQETLRQLQLSYQRAALNVPTFNYSVDEKKIEDAKATLTATKNAEKQAYDAFVGSKGNGTEIQEAETRLKEAKDQLKVLEADAEAERKNVEAEVEAARQKLVELGGLQPTQGASTSEAVPEPSPIQFAAPETSPDPAAAPEPSVSPSTSPEPTSPVSNTEPEMTELEIARKAYADAQAKLATLTFPAIDAQKAYIEQCEKKLNALLGTGGALYDAYQAAVSARESAEDALFNLERGLEEKKQADNKSQQLSYLDMQDISAQIAKVQKEIAELSGGEENQIVARVSGTVQSIECTAGDMTVDEQVLCSIEVPDMGYTLSFSATNEQARRLRVGDSASISNYYWGNEVVATLTTIKTDPKNPMSNKILTFDLSGDVTAGAELSISVGQKSANYDLIIPNSSIRSDTNGSFVLKIEAKNSPLGNRYYASRVDIEVLASDDKNSAVTGDLSYGDYVITTGNAPVANGDMVRLADN